MVNKEDSVDDNIVDNNIIDEEIIVSKYLIEPASIFWTLFFGFVAFFAPFFAIYLIDYFSKASEIINSVMPLFFLAIITIVVLVIRTIMYFNDRKFKEVLINSIVTTICVVSLIYNLLIFVAM